MNAAKTKALLSQPGELVHAISSPAFSRRLTGEGETCSARKRRLVTCQRCGKQMQEVSLQRHMLSQHNDYQRPSKWAKLLEESTHEPVAYQVSMPVNGVRGECPVPGCVGRATTRCNLRTHFAHRHPFDIITVEEEGLLPQCISCGLFTSTANTPRHQASLLCRRGSIRKRKRDLGCVLLRGMEIGFSVTKVTFTS